MFADLNNFSLSIQCSLCWRIALEHLSVGNKCYNSVSYNLFSSPFSICGMVFSSASICLAGLQVVTPSKCSCRKGLLEKQDAQQAV